MESGNLVGLKNSFNSLTGNPITLNTIFPNIYRPVQHKCRHSPPDAALECWYA